MGGVQRPARSRWRSADDRQLATGIRDGDPAACDELSERYRPLLIKLAATHCSRLGHRGGRCPGFDGCDQAFAAAYSLLVRRLPRVFADHHLDGAAPPRVVLGEHATGVHTDILREWNRIRGLVQRPRLRGAPGRRLADAFAAWHASSASVAEAGRLGHPITDDAQKWLDALHADACQPASEHIDASRVLRRIAHSLDEPPPPEPLPPPLARCVVEADRVFARVAPERYDEWLDRPRRQTRTDAPFETVAGSGSHSEATRRSRTRQ